MGAALKLIEPGRGDFLLESVEGGSVRARYSLLGLDPDLMFRATGHGCEVNRQWRHDRTAFEPLAGDSLAELRALAQSCRIDVPAALPPALACLVGYFGYETIGLVENLPRAPQSALEMPDMLFARPTLLLVFDGLTDELFCIAPLWADGSDPAQAVERAGERIDAALSQLTNAAPPSARDASLPEMALSPVTAAADYEAMVLKAQEYIAAGDIFQVVLAQRFTCPFPLPPFQLYRALRRVNPSPFLYFLDLPDFAVVGSPGDNDGADDSGAAYIFQRSGDTWTETAKLKAGNAAANDLFGWSVAMDGDFVIVAAPNGNGGLGSAYVFQRTGADWLEVDELEGLDSEEDDDFGYAVALEAGYALVGAPHDTNDGVRSGSVYVFHLEGDFWNQVNKLTGNDAAAEASFGWSVALASDDALIGAPSTFGDDTDPGSAYAFERQPEP